MVIIKNNMHILMTRPLDDSKEMILRFKDLGHKLQRCLKGDIHEVRRYNVYNGLFDIA